MIIEPLSDGHGLEIVDPLDKSRFVLHTPTPVSPTEVQVDAFDFPVETTVMIRTSAIENSDTNIFVRDLDGVSRFDSNVGSDKTQLTDDNYVVEFSNAPMKVYFSVSGAISYKQNNSGSILSFDGERDITIGARSTVQKPAGTITVTDDTDDIMRAMSLFGSALRTTRSECSYPRHRGHPPLIERGEKFHVPSSIAPQKTETTLVLPPEKEYLYPATSLAYYLNSSVVEGGDPRLVVGDFEYELDDNQGYEKAVERVLRQVFFLDCLARTNGSYQVTLYEREQVEPQIDIDLDSLFDAPLEERLPTYLGVPFDVLEPAISPWHLTVDMVPTTENVEILPFLANKLAFVRMAHPRNEPRNKKSMSIHEFFRRESTDRSPEVANEASKSTEIFEMAGEADTRQRAWVGPGYPLRWSKLTYEGLHSRLARKKTGKDTSATINVTIICNESTMRDESEVVNYYELRDQPRFDIDVYHQTTKAELTDLLMEQSDFLHYIGHISDSGMQCDDGNLDTRQLSKVNTTMFLLNACSSYEQGMGLIERGSTAGIVTLAKVSNTTATKIGQSLIRLLSTGFSLQDALLVLNRVYLTGYQYIALGDDAVTLCQSKGIFVASNQITQGTGETFSIEMYGSSANHSYQGAIMSSVLEKEERYYLSSDSFETFEVSADELEEFFAEETMPVIINDELYWSNELTADKVRELL